MEKNTVLFPPIPLDEAIQQAANWRNYCGKLVGGQRGNKDESLPVMKAFYVPLSDLLDVVELAKNDSGKFVVGMRLYFRLENEEDDLNDLKAMVVPVVLDDTGQLKDWTHRMQEKDVRATDYSLVFDFTKPCPTECDNESPLSK